MSESIDTEVKGSPGQVRDTADLLRTLVGPAAGAVGDTLVDARRGAEDSWSSPAGEAFTSRTSELVMPVDQLETFLREAAYGLDHLAGELEHSQRLMEAIRDDAAAAGLTVRGNVIEHPGPPLPEPGPMPVDADTHAAAAHADQMNAYNAQRARLDAFTAAAAEAAEVRSRESAAARSWGELVAKRQQGKVSFVAADLFVSTMQGIVSERGKRHEARSRELLERSRRLAEGTGRISGYEARRAAFEEGRRLRGEAFRHQVARTADVTSSRKLGRLGGPLAVGGFIYDVAVLDKPWHQAAVSGGVGFGASVAAAAAAGAAIGTVIPVPFVGTALGAVVGTGVGIFTSGAVDSLFLDGEQSFGSAVDAGQKAVSDTLDSAEQLSKQLWGAIF